MVVRFLLNYIIKGIKKIKINCTEWICNEVVDDTIFHVNIICNIWVAKPIFDETNKSSISCKLNVYLIFVIWHLVNIANNNDAKAACNITVGY